VRLKSLTVVIAIAVATVAVAVAIEPADKLVSIMPSDKDSHVKLSNKNYEIWAVLMYAILTRKGLAEVATGELPKPTSGPNSAAGKAWARKNAEARAEMILAVETNQLAHMTAETAAKIWTELERIHRA